MSQAFEALALGLLVALLAAAAILVWRRFHRTADGDEEGGDAAEYMSMMIALLYALLLGLSLVNVWEMRSAAEGHTSTEAGALHQMTVLSEGMPASRAARIDALAERYAAHVVQYEWPRMQQHEQPGEPGWSLVRQLRAAAAAPADAPPPQQATAAELLGQLAVLDDARRGREAVSQETLSPLLWAGMAVGAVLSFWILFFYGIGRGITNLVMVMGMVLLTVFLGLLIHYLATPFGETMGVSPDAFTRYFPESAGTAPEG